MKTKLKDLVAVGLFACGFCLMHLGCANGTGTVTLAPGGVYSDPVLAQEDQAILDASNAIQGFLSWYDANAALLSKTPALANLATSVRAQEKGWIKDAFAARDAYAAASKAYRTAVAQSSASPGSAAPDVAPQTAALAKFQVALAIIDSVTAQIAAYRAAHP